MSDELSDSLAPGDALHLIAEQLQAPVPLRSGLADRVGVRRMRRRRERRIMSSVGFVAVLAVSALVLRPKATDTLDRPITFELDAPSSHSVALVGDFTDWKSDKIQLLEGASGKWQVTVSLPPGRYRFAYLVDKDEWRADAEASPIPDDFGRPTSVVTVSVNQ